MSRINPSARPALALFAALCASASALATDYSWNGTAGNWSSTTRWSPNGTPGAGDNILTPTQFTTLAVDLQSRSVQNWTYSPTGASSWLINIVNGTSASPNSFTLGVTGTLTQSGGTLSFRGNGDATSYLGFLTLEADQLAHSGGTLNLGDASRYLHRAAIGSGTVSSNTGATTLNFNTTTASVGGLTLSAAAGATTLVNLNSSSTTTTSVAYRQQSTVEIASLSALAPAGNIIVAAGNTGQGAVMGATLRLTAESGSATFGGTLINNAGASTSRTLTVQKVGAGEQILTGVNTYTGPTTVGGGRLLVEGAGSIANSTVTIASGGTFGGTGVAGALVLQAGGALDPTSTAAALSASSLTWNGESSGGLAQMSFALGTAPDQSLADRLTLSGALDKGSGDHFVFDFGGGGAAGRTYTLLSFASTSFAVSDFSYINLGSGLAGEFVLGADSLGFSVTAVPEPSAFAAVLGLAALGSATLRRRRR